MPVVHDAQEEAGVAESCQKRPSTIPSCPYRQPQTTGKSPTGCGGEAGCRCANDVERAIRAAIGRVLGDLAAASALGLDKKSAVIAIARAEGAAFGCKSLSMKVHARWTAEHVAVHGELPSDRTMRRWYRASFDELQEASARSTNPATLDESGREGRLPT